MPFTKECVYCSMELMWDNDSRKFIEVDSEKQHFCKKGPGGGNEPRPKKCQYCGFDSIIFNKKANKFFDNGTENIHNCPNYEFKHGNLFQYLDKKKRGEIKDIPPPPPPIITTMNGRNGWTEEQKKPTTTPPVPAETPELLSVLKQIRNSTDQIALIIERMSKQLDVMMKPIDFMAHPPKDFIDAIQKEAKLRSANVEFEQGKQKAYSSLLDDDIPPDPDMTAMQDDDIYDEISDTDDDTKL